MIKKNVFYNIKNYVLSNTVISNNNICFGFNSYMFLFGIFVYSIYFVF